MSRRLILAAVVAVSALISGCASAPMASDEANEQAKKFMVQPGLANIYVYRNTSFGAMVPFDIEVNGRVVGKTAPNTFMLLRVKPGKYVIVSIGESESTVELSVVAGKNYFVRQEIKQGVYNPTGRLHLVDEAAGRSGVEECNLIDLSKK